jgi:hypothetical protein
MPLSAKAKGKQRAIDSEDEVSKGALPESGPSEVIVRFTDGIPDVSFALDASYTIQDIKFLVSRLNRSFNLRALYKFR